MAKNRKQIIQEELKRNVTTTFLLYNLNLNYALLTPRGLVEAYIGNIDEYTGDVDELMDSKYEVHLLFKRDSNVSDLYRNTYYIREYDLESHFVLVFKYPKEYEKFFEFVTNTEYSKIPKELTDRITPAYMHGLQLYYKPTVNLVIQKDPSLMTIIKEIYDLDFETKEYWKLFDWFNENLDYNKII